MIESYYDKSTGYVLDFVDLDGDGEQVSYCITQDGDDILIGRHWIEGGVTIEEAWKISMKLSTFNELIEQWIKRQNDE